MSPWARNPWRRFRLPPRLGWLFVGAYGLAAALVVASSIGGWEGAYATRPVDEIALAVCLLFGAGCAGYAARSAAGRHRAGWLAMVTAQLGWAAGEVIWAVYDVRPGLAHATHPAAAEIVLLLWPFGAYASLVLLSRFSRQSPRRLVLDGLIVATSLFVVSWVFVLEKQLREDSGSQATTIAEVFNDVLLLTTSILMLSRVRRGDPPSRNLLAGGVTTISIADIAMVFKSGIGSYQVSDLVDLGRVGGLAMIALAALSSVYEVQVPGARDDEIRSRTRLWLPYLPLMVAAAVGLTRAVRLMAHGPLLIALGILVAAVLVRQFVMLMENQRLLSEVAREAFRDSLTGLANRAYFLDRLEQAVARRSCEISPIAVLCLDLDNFKSVNDALGHPAGDELLIRVAGRLTAALDEKCVTARLGGDEFAVLIEGSVQESQAAAHRVLQAFNAPILVDGVPIPVRPSVGYTVATASSDCSVEQLLRHADLAMYTAKREGGQCIRNFVPDLSLSLSTPQPAGPAPAAVEVAEPSAAPMRRRAADVGTSRPVQPQGGIDGIRWPPTAIRISLALLMIGVVAFTATSALYPNASHSVFFAKSLYSALNLLAAGLIAVRACRLKADRLAWSLIAAGMALSALGDVAYALWVPNAQSPSVADPEYLAFYPFVYAGILLLMRSRLKRVPMPIRLDSLVCALAVAALAAALRAGPMHAAAARTPATVLVGLVYPWGDLVLLALAVGMLPILGWRSEFRWGFLVVGLVGFAVADTAYLFQTSAGSYRVGTTLDALWPASSLLVAMASWARWSSAAPAPRRGLSSYAVPVTCTVVALGVAILGHDSRLASTLAALSLVAVAARFSVTFRDISMLAESHKQAMTDELTTLPNRRSLATALTELSASASPVRTSSNRALLLLNLHKLREINDSVGRHFGDELVWHIANRLAHSVRRDDLLARVSDEEFAILLGEGSDLVAARAQAGRLLEGVSIPFELDAISVQIDASIAIALYPDHCDHPQELLNRAEAAIPHAKSALSRIAVYESAFEIDRDHDPNLVGELRAALIDGDQLTVHYQPKVNASDGSVHSVEALLRWQHPTRGLLLPEEFLPAAERAGLMRTVAHRTLNLTLEQIRSWRDHGIPLTVAVNLSTTNLLDLDLAVTIERLLRVHGLPPDALIVEITESALVDSDRSRNTVAALQLLGVRISLDDYGTGWSSLARLQDVSVDELKLDRRFVARLAQDPRSVAIVQSTVDLAQNLGADLVAEGVEDEATLSALRGYGCTITQGFVHSAPLPPDELQRWITTGSAIAGVGSERSAVTD
ncbi:bifunctional diguanylate cyclase/phosphodiesterase [Mycobacterium paraffinicum]|uniref:GGDEF-domain containing protein n=1 Tax=Mycobacterium paraffinicum TaxID=53378 RepID=A0ABP8RLC6_9MYCO|nr:bifunctional diguanylate cyclase/phosphodiesterase [Mycobacterium paraffinicum]MCV7312622.1 bifunctional diguanylate cyclase/phosphodiesterase [Mycobacterium paraffinicum]